MLRNVSGQRWRVFAWDVTTGLPKTGDAANITARITKDDGTPAATNDTNPTQVDATNEPGYYDFDLTQAESDAVKGSLSPKSSTSNVAVIACPPVVYTRPQYASLTVVDSNGRLDVSKVSGTPQTARDIGASVLLSSGTGTGQVSLSSGAVLLQATQTGVIIPTVTTLTNAPSDSSGVTTLLSRVPSGLFTGITSLAQWLGLIAGKQTGNSTARTELRATGAGSGTFDETTDSQEAIRDNQGTAQTGDAYARLGAPAGASVSADVAALPASILALFSDDVGTAQAGAAGTITLRSGAVATDDYYNGAVVCIYGGTGAGQSRKITDYVGSTKVVTVDSNWVTNPDSSSTYFIIGRIA